ncbi:UNVERIFIED_CONTAM: hypothetical protein GTU68_050168 [Idotea baltica]|nr:hypothetical protein [Idotea baltica]
MGDPPPPRSPRFSFRNKQSNHIRKKIQRDAELKPLSHRVVLLDEHHQFVIGNNHIVALKDRKDEKVIELAIKSPNKIVGWIVIEQKNTITGGIVSTFYAQQQKNLYLIIIFAGIFSLIIAAFLVRFFLLPLKELDKGAKALSQGDFTRKIQINGHDELAELGHAFNSLAFSLAKQKETREQWITDISHELRTPIAVLRSEIEAMQDGIRKLDIKYINSMHYQVLNLAQLVEDLYLLSCSDSGIYPAHLKPLELIQLVDNLVTKFEHRLQEKNLVLDRKYSTSTRLEVWADEKTLNQLMANLLENSLRYTDEFGTVAISINGDEHQIELKVEDSAPSVKSHQLSRLFDRLYRVDQSRSRQFGGSGLGLSICKSIVDSHNGEIKAGISSLGGLAITVTFFRENAHALSR